MRLYQFLTCCGGMLAHSSLLHPFSSLKCAAFIHAQLSHGATTAPQTQSVCNTWILLFFSHFIGKLLLSFGSLPSYMTQTCPRFCCWTDGLTSDSRMFWYTEDFMVKLVTTRCQIPVCAKKKAPKTSPPPLCWQLVVQRTLLRFCGLLRCSFADLSHAAMFFSDRRRFPSKQAIPLQSIPPVVNCLTC